MLSPAAEHYNVVPYPTGALPSVSPERLFVIGTIFGMNPADVRTARVAEIGCGNGMHIIPFAARYPDSTCIGFDYASHAIEEAQTTALHLGLTNCRFECRDIREQFDAETFDYIIVHGMYSWTPQEVRDAILQTCKRLLSPNGICFISYNTMPGGYVRQMIRDMMVYHTAGIESPSEKVKEARAILYFAAKANEHSPGTWRSLLFDEANRIGKYPDNVLFHDDLCDDYKPVTFTEFITHAMHNGLQFLGEADMVELQLEVPEMIRNVLATIASNNLLAREQYLDYIRYRRFRQTLLVHDSCVVDRNLSGDRIRSMSVATRLRLKDTRSNENGELLYVLADSANTEVQTEDRFIASAIDILGKHFPRTLEISAVVNQTITKLDIPADDGKVAELWDTLSAFLLRAYCNDVVEFYPIPLLSVHTLSENPSVWDVARRLASKTSVLPTPRHNSFEYSSPFESVVIQCTDGSRTIQDIAHEVDSAIQQGIIPRPATDTNTTVEAVRTFLQRLRDEGLIVA